MIVKKIFFLTACLILSVQAQAIELLNVSYDPTRELYKEYNRLFAEYWQQQSGEQITVKTSHGGSGKQARAVIDGLQADVVTLALAGDIDALNKHQDLIDPNWRQRLSECSLPYRSTIVFLVRKGNPKRIYDWQDLVRDPSIEVITPNPKTSGGARWNFLAAWAYAQDRFGREQQALEFVTRLYQQVPVLDTGARGATMSFIQRGLGDVLLAWENEAYLALQEEGGDQFEIITPKVSIVAEPPVAVVDKVVDKKGTRKQAEAYLNYLYSDAAQRLIAKHYYRPASGQILAEFHQQFPELRLLRMHDIFGGGWELIQPKFFNDGAIFDQILEKIYQ
ncbi:sulfate ABC transporter substrate-binding protein [Actinobacillus pleuropneumoniae]|uniref:Sulfate-binding protein n=1 Tax=Actinobacillus pleuropneumoniae serotype 7 (strain AP76) TaxID=537457 RepID=B3GZA1_ACTP7|nr:sulfate ABC transporter substrate-binding protein [Actinobacillus pleuropneumoniae]ACE62587.1 sulfate-binding protein precursor [Actinobacillus pleuropneumoniae serovar 7 str. AP76]EFN01844.1 Sulfate ABC transporter, periplasmic sulfate-binding protein [Actinobacillus pleuropneumoniae serovar 13 str. N273]UKH39991.1 sulfate ABC transporter substrate-binding protein [Actinobacillus pleuropneumoniae]